MSSAHLDEIISKHHQITNAQIVFLDIESYSKRRTQNQVAVVGEFTEAVNRALLTVSQKFTAYAQANGVNFSTDIVRLPTGDGAAIGFAFEGLHGIHLDFALAVLDETATLQVDRCERFDAEGWCNCHTYFNLRIGLSEGKVVVFKDINGAYNLAGNPVNMAARVMGLVGRNQIALTSAAFDQLVDLSSDPNMADKFREFKDVAIKHGLRVDIFQYVDTEKPGLNGDAPEELAAAQEVDAIIERVRSFAPGFPSMLPPRDAPVNPAERVAVFRSLEALMQMMATFSGQPKTPIEPGSIVAPGEELPG